MPIGDSLGNPKLWVGGTNTFADTRVASTDIFYSLPLDAGVPYALGVNSGAYDTYMELYDTLAMGQASISTDDDSGAGSNALINYTPSVTGIYYIRASAFTPTDSGAFSVDSDVILNYPHKTLKTNNQFNLFSNFKLSSILSPNLFTMNKISKVKTSNKILNFNTVGRRKSNNVFNIVEVKRAKTNNKFEMLSQNKMMPHKQNRKVWSKKGYEIFANGVLIGYFPEGTFTLNDLVLADGDYDIEVRPLGNFYRNTFVRQTFRINCDAGGAGVIEIFPLIYDLVSVINQAKTNIGWTILPQINASTAKIGLWFGVSSGIVITGTPDVSINVGALLQFKYAFKQVTSQWVAVAFYEGAARGASSELELIWSVVVPDQPENQHIEE